MIGTWNYGCTELNPYGDLAVVSKTMESMVHGNPDESHDNIPGASISSEGALFESSSVPLFGNTPINLNRGV